MTSAYDRNNKTPKLAQVGTPVSPQARAIKFKCSCGKGSPARRKRKSVSEELVHLWGIAAKQISLLKERGLIVGIEKRAQSIHGTGQPIKPTERRKFVRPRLSAYGQKQILQLLRYAFLPFVLLHLEFSNRTRSSFAHH